jgi:hypothetical protein
MKLLSASSAIPLVMNQDKVLHKWQALSTCQGNGLATQAEWRRIHTYVDTTRHNGDVPRFGQRPLTLEDTVLEAVMQDQNVIDQDDQIYQCLVQQLIVKEHDAYDLILVDEAQDLNRANITFLRRVVAPVAYRTVVCAVGDPTQAIYGFRGASPDAMDQFGATFQARSMHLTYCFRCPRRILFLASQLHPDIRPPEGAPLGSVHIIVSSNPWKTLVDRIHPGTLGGTLFLARNNQTILAALSYIYHTADSVSEVHWLSPGISRELHAVLCEGGREATIGCLLKSATVAVEQPTVAATDRVLQKILEIAVQLEGSESDPQTSQWLNWLMRVLNNRGRNGLTLATVHAVKGEEWPNVIIYDFNLFGHNENGRHSNQDLNLLYIAITRSQNSLTFLQSKRTSHIPSPLLPVDLVHYAREMWPES